MTALRPLHAAPGTGGRANRRRRAATAPLVAALLAGVVLAGCGTTRPDPPPYPQVSERGRYQPAWVVDSIGKAPVGFAPAVVGDAVWAASGAGRVSLIDAGGGRLRKRIDLDTPLAAGVGSDGRLQVVVTRAGEVVAFDRDGAERWRSALGAEVVAVPTVGDDIVVIRTVDGRILALDREGGSVRWTWRQQPLPALTLRQNAGVAIDGDTIYAGLPAGRVVALDARLGAPRWETVMSSARGATELERLIDVAGTPVVTGERVCAIAYQGRVACLRRDDGRIVWARDIQSGTGIAMRDDRIYTVDGSDLVRAFAVAGDDLWKQDAYVRRVMSAPVEVDGRLLLTDRFGSLHVLDAANGAPLARVEADGSGFTGRPVLPTATGVTRAGDGAAFAYAQTVGGSLVAVPLK
ncbi:MAG: outer membrane protein assembly factor BamB [Lautropia sp.]